MKVFVGLVAAILLAAALQFGSVTPCGVLRYEIRKAAAKAGGAQAFVAALPDWGIDGFLATKFGPITEGRCIALFFEHPSAETSHPSIQPVSGSALNSGPSTYRRATARDLAAERQAAAVSLAGTRECTAEKTSGDLQTFSLEASCANIKMMTAFEEASYRYMDLIFHLAEKRVVVADQLDRGLIDKAEAKSQIFQSYTAAGNEERRRDRIGGS